MKKTILVTGSTKGIGFETARQLLELGHQVIVSGRNPSHLKNAVSKLDAYKHQLIPLVMDVSDTLSIRKAADEIYSKQLKLDVLINNAAILLKEDQSLHKNSDDTFNLTIQTNGTGPLLVIQAFLPVMNSTSRIINISSNGGSMTDPIGGWAPAYCISKSMVNALTRYLAYELASKKISVNAVCPGWVQSDMGGKAAPRSLAKGAETPVWLATESNQNLTGSFFRDKQEIPW